ncbi:hypothetical protein DSECCO2_477520 [anaerobic digester metagenome]
MRAAQVAVEVFAQAVDDGRVALQEHAQSQAVGVYPGHGRPFGGDGRLLLDEGRQDDHAVQGRGVPGLGQVRHAGPEMLQQGVEDGVGAPVRDAREEIGLGEEIAFGVRGVDALGQKVVPVPAGLQEPLRRGQARGVHGLGHLAHGQPFGEAQAVEDGLAEGQDFQNPPWAHGLGQFELPCLQGQLAVAPVGPEGLRVPDQPLLLKLRGHAAQAFARLDPEDRRRVRLRVRWRFHVSPRGVQSCRGSDDRRKNHAQGKFHPRLHEFLR